MPIFLLIPINTDASDWAVSSIIGPVQVIADDDSQARHVAAHQLIKKTGLSTEQAWMPNPWLRVDRVRLEQITIASSDIPLIEGQLPKSLSGRPNKLSLYRLSPRLLDASDWELSTSTDVLYVRAHTTSHARAIAAIHYGLMMRQLDNKLMIPPWWNPKFVLVEEIDSLPAECTVLTPDHKPPRSNIRMRPKG